MTTITARKRERLNKVCIEYCELEEEKRVFYIKKMVENDMQTATIQTLYTMQSRIDHLVKEIVDLVDWFTKNNRDHNNEVAVLVHDYFAPQIHRGLSNLI